MPVSPYAMPRPTVAPSGSSAQEDPPGPMPMITMITGIVAFACAMAPLAGPAAIIMGHLTLIKVNARKDQKGKGMTIAGLVLGYSSLVLVAIIWVNFVGPMVMKEQ